HTLRITRPTRRPLHRGISTRPTSALGHKQTNAPQQKTTAIRTLQAGAARLDGLAVNIHSRLTLDSRVPTKRKPQMRPIVFVLGIALASATSQAPIPVQRPSRGSTRRAAVAIIWHAGTVLRN